MDASFANRTGEMASASDAGKSKRGFPASLLRFVPRTRASKVALVIYSLIGAATCVVGMRVVRTKWFYSGNYEENYFAGLTPIDALWFVVLFAAVLLGTCLLLVAYRALLERIPARRMPVNPTVVFCVTWVVIFVCWVPYFLANFPGSLYADSIVIMKQALGINVLTSHHPIAYVGLIGFFLHLGDILFDSYIVGIAFYTAFQMVFMSGVFAYFLGWLASHRVPLSAIVVTCAAFALLSIFPLHAVSMWKDGLYAAFVLRVSLLLFDVVASRGAALEEPAMLIRLALWGLAVCLVRSNGIYVMLCVWVALLALYAMRTSGKVFFSCGISLALYFVVVGPLSIALEVQTEPVESYGIPLQQVAAVVVYDGEMNPEEKEFLNTLLPLDEYKEEYIPCSVDGIKWADNFDMDFFDTHRGEFMQVWLSLLPKNLGLYASSYIMESYEYWSFADVNRTFTLNGVNDKYDAPDLGIIETNLVEVWFGEGVNQLFPFKFFHLQEGAHSWIVLFAGLLLFVARREQWHPQWLAARQMLPAWPPFAHPWWLALFPTFVNWLTVLISSPFAALPRYILPAIFLMPLFILLPWPVVATQER